MLTHFDRFTTVQSVKAIWHEPSSALSIWSRMWLCTPPFFKMLKPLACNEKELQTNNNIFFPISFSSPNYTIKLDNPICRDGIYNRNNKADICFPLYLAWGGAYKSDIAKKNRKKNEKKTKDTNPFPLLDSVTKEMWLICCTLALLNRVSSIK